MVLINSSIKKYISFFLLVMLICNVWAVQDFPSQALPGVYLVPDMLDGFEASGVAWSVQLKRLYVVSDEGSFFSIDQNGGNVSNWQISGDLEAITVVESKPDFVYLGIENPDSIYEYNILTSQITRVFLLTDWMTGASNSGLEALAFVPDDNNPEGGLFYAGLQSDGSIYIFQLPIASSSSSTDVTFIDEITSSYNDLSGLAYMATQDVVYAVHDSYDLLEVLTPDGDLIGQWELPGDNQEGIAVKGCDLYIAQDNGSSVSDLINYSSFKILSQPDINSDGNVSLCDFAILSVNWMVNDPVVEVNMDDNVNMLDLEILLESWLTGHCSADPNH